MGILSVIITLFMSVVFNICLPTGDIGSDINLMHKTLNYDLGESLELEGCKACHHKTEKEVYYPQNTIAENQGRTCLYNLFFFCGLYSSVLRKYNRLETIEWPYLKNESLRLNVTTGTLEVSNCNEIRDHCCITKKHKFEKQTSPYSLDSKKLFIFTARVKNFDTFMIAGNSTPFKCLPAFYNTKFKELYRIRLEDAIASFPHAKRHFFRYSWINQSVFAIEGQSRAITGPDIECGVLFIEANTNKIASTISGQTGHFCNEDICLTHLKALHSYSSILGFAEWRKKTDYVTGIKVGGLTCNLLKIYGSSIIIPMIFNFLFNAVWYIKDVREKKANILEVIPLLLLFYPQYKTVKFIAQFLFIHFDEKRLVEEKEENDRTIVYLEPYIESCLQVS